MSFFSHQAGSCFFKKQAQEATSHKVELNRVRVRARA